MLANVAKLARPRCSVALPVWRQWHDREPHSVAPSCTRYPSSSRRLTHRFRQSWQRARAPIPSSWRRAYPVLNPSCPICPALASLPHPSALAPLPLTARLPYVPLSPPTEPPNELPARCSPTWNIPFESNRAGLSSCRTSPLQASPHVKRVSTLASPHASPHASPCAHYLSHLYIYVGLFSCLNSSQMRSTPILHVGPRRGPSWARDINSLTLCLRQLASCEEHNASEEKSRDRREM